MCPRWGLASLAHPTRAKTLYLRWTIMIAQPRPLMEVLAEIPDFRRSRASAIPYPPFLQWPVVPCSVVIAAIVPSPNGDAITASGIAQALGFTHNTPCASTLHTIFRCVDRDELEAELGAWADSMVASIALPPRRPKLPWRSMAKRCGARASKVARGPPVVCRGAPRGPDAASTGGGRQDQ